MIPLKDGSLIGRLEEPALRREWRSRLEDHDGHAEGEGGIARWLMLTDGLGLDREMVISTRRILPATRFAVEAYLHFVRERSLLEAIASSLTELFSPMVIGQRVSGMLQHYDFVSAETLAYFAPRLTQAPRDAEMALDYVKRHALRLDQQQAVLDALIFKCQVLWTSSMPCNMPTSRPARCRPAPGTARRPAAGSNPVRPYDRDSGKRHRPHPAWREAA